MSKTHCKHGHERTPDNVNASGGCRTCKREQAQARYATDEAYRELRQAQWRERYATNEEFRKSERERYNRRMHSDAVFHGRVLERLRERRSAVRADPVLLEAHREYNRLWSGAKRRAAGIAPLDLQVAHRPRPTPDFERLPAAPLLAWLEAWLLSHPDVTEPQLCDWAHVAHRSLIHGRDGRSLSLDLIDRLLIAAGELPETLHALYPIEVLHDDGTGNFSGGFDGESGASFPVVLPEPVPVSAHIKTKSVDDWEPRWESWPPEHRAILQRLRAELTGAKWRRHSIAWLNQQKVAA